MNNTLIIPDLHIPAEHKDALRFLKDLYKTYKCTKVVSIGDLVDLHSISFHPKNPSLPSPSDELKLIKERLKPWIRTFPNMEICDSNHDYRVYRIAESAGIPAECVKSINDIFDMPKSWIFKPKIVLHGIDTILLQHHMSAVAGKAAKNYGCSTIEGHLHSKLSITYWDTLVGKHRFSAYCGNLIDGTHKAMQYYQGCISGTRGTIVLIDGKPIIEVL